MATQILAPIDNAPREKTKDSEQMSPVLTQYMQSQPEIEPYPHLDHIDLIP